MKKRIRSFILYPTIFVVVFAVAFGIRAYTFNTTDKNAVSKAVQHRVFAYFTAIQKKDYKTAATMAEYPTIHRPKNISVAEMLSQSSATSPLISYHIDSIKIISPIEALVNITSTSLVMKEKFVKGKPVMYPMNVTGETTIRVYNKSGTWRLYME